MREHETLLRLHHVQSIEDALHRDHGQPHHASAWTQVGNWVAIYDQVQTRPAGVFRTLRRCAPCDRSREKIKGWLRIKKIALIVSVNPTWRDLSLEWYRTPRFSAGLQSKAPNGLHPEASACCRPKDLCIRPAASALPANCIGPSARMTKSGLRSDQASCDPKRRNLCHFQSFPAATSFLSRIQVSGRTAAPSLRPH